MTIDGYTVHPLSFPGGNIGKLAVCGTINDLACRGAQPLFLALGVIAEEGFDESELLRYLSDAAEVCRQTGVRIVTGDTKVVPRGQLDRLVLTTCGLGKTRLSRDLGIAALKPGDSLLLTGPIGLHGATISITAAATAWSTSSTPTPTATAVPTAGKSITPSIRPITGSST